MNPLRKSPLSNINTTPTSSPSAAGPEQPESATPRPNTDLNDQAALLLKKYGKLPDKKRFLDKRVSERKFFDSGDWAMNKAGKASVLNIGKQHPSPSDIPHGSVNLQFSQPLSPVKSHSTLVPPETTMDMPLEAKFRTE
ncbi:mRNA stability protein mug134 [Neolecta irregularis DAH-3]|uniref:mRNA stability protein n=1 Tax=Neolecta irregularis (strain DAH-3) TaxID=1198029 RepID=A0A1U7LW75_NEOID|nr:mRNA stability protein mug134 [Neolecta irregularis DAH-3]|eukprot:OLL26802.1 mRNA stability protein mug134 [Neolecta irregularis DAH-3]